ncbi:hypothetical protein POM88_044361 [Heracleum sosnowskyi]|uniref:Uncharacterized protein n=1 Tax=Heracleum sosnowskyi TaxID=360622 RepID=A0AAD8H2N3_9APIA|nr:hypothetical protein POM88_044361 [Heracleum sosnowskyi]
MLIDSADSVVKLADFGLSREIDIHLRSLTKQDDGAEVTSLRMIQENYVEAENCSSGSESSEAAISKSCSISSSKTPVSDSTIFKYYLEGLSERSLMLKEIAMAASELELANFAEQVSQYSGCFHHMHQIVMSKKLIEDGTKAWNLVSKNNKQVLWENLSSEIEEQFKKISCCSTRYLSLEDLELLRKIAGCQELVLKGFKTLGHLCCGFLHQEAGPTLMQAIL